MINTPDSLVDRQFKVDVNVDKKDLGVDVEIASPWTKAFVHGRHKKKVPRDIHYRKELCYKDIHVLDKLVYKGINCFRFKSISISNNKLLVKKY